MSGVEWSQGRMYTPGEIRLLVATVIAMFEYLSDGREPDGAPLLLSLDRVGEYSRLH